MPSGVHKLFPWGWPGLAKICKTPISFFKKMAVNCRANHVFSIFYCMPHRYIHTMECYKTFHCKRYMKHKYILFITILPYRIILTHVITLTMNYPNKDNETDCKFRSNIKDICIMNTKDICIMTWLTYLMSTLLMPLTHNKQMIWVQSYRHLPTCTQCLTNLIHS